MERLLGLTLNRIIVTDDTITFESSCDRKFMMYHYQEGCESVFIEEIHGDMDDLIGNPVTLSECISNSMSEHETNATMAVINPIGQYSDECHLWTFYKICTIKGCVTIRWLGESNGYYSMDVDFKEITGEN